ncbi:MAG: hypothetical protein AAF404_02410, partial [Pseudomonadota bacterium]
MKALTTSIASSLCLSLAACTSSPNITGHHAGEPVIPSDEPQVTITEVTQQTDNQLSTPAAATPQACDIGSAINWMANQKIIYAQSPSNEWRDCSGNFLRLSSRIATVCPGVELAAPPGITRYVHGGNNKRPGMAQARTTRGLAHWYDKKGMFTPVYYDNTPIEQAPLALKEIRNRIKPGSVLWFAHRKPQSKDGKTSLYDEASGMINHMGTV